LANSLQTSARSAPRGDGDPLCQRYRPEEIFAKLRQADALLGEGKKVPEVVKPDAREY
jgi:hypothetical protein